jgi:hypothetical protein
MTTQIRILSSAQLLLGLLVLSLSMFALQNIGQATQHADELRHSPRIAVQLSYRLQSLTTAYELVLNEYYSTVIDETRYRTKLGSLQLSIDSDIATLGALSKPEYAAAGHEIRRSIGDIEKYRQLLDKAMQEGSRDWDAAREALFKVNILSTQAIEVASRLAKASTEHGTALETSIAQLQQQAQWFMIAAAIAAGLLGVISLSPFLKRQ